MQYFIANKMVLLSVLSILLLSGCEKNEDSIDYPKVGLNPDYPTLEIMNYLGNTQNTHPKVLYFKDGWNGYKYWMAYTAYPFADDTAENPCLAVSRMDNTSGNREPA